MFTGSIFTGYACVELFPADGELASDEPVHRGSLRPTTSSGRMPTTMKREVSPDVWQLMVSDGPGRSGRPRRRTMRVHGSEAQADEVLKALAETAIAASRLGDLRVRELIDRYLSWIDDDVTPVERARLHHLADDAVDPAVGSHFAALLNGADIVRLLEGRRGGGATSGELSELHHLLAGAYRWARDNRWTSLNPTDDVAVRDILR